MQDYSIYFFHFEKYNGCFPRYHHFAKWYMDYLKIGQRVFGKSVILVDLSTHEPLYSICARK